MIFKNYIPEWLNSFNILVFFLWQSTSFLATQNIFVIFSNYVPNWRCKDNGTFDNNCTIFNSGCELEYENNYFSSASIKFGWVCSENNYITSFQSQLQFFGVLVGTVIFGLTSDGFGRKITSIIDIGMGCFLIILSAFINDSKVFFVIRFLLGLSIGGALNSAITYSSEVLPPQQRLFVKCFFNWGLSRVIMTFICYFFNDYSSALFISGIILIPSVLLLIFYFPESPTWYHYKHKEELMIQSEKKIAQLSHLPYEGSQHEPITNKESFLSLLKDKNTFKRLSVLWCMWFVASLCGHAMDLHSNKISGNLYINQFFFGFTIYISKLLIPYIDKNYLWFTRRVFHQSAQTIVIVCFGILAFLVSIKYNGIGILILNIIGIVFIEFCWDACYLCALESMPTNVRSSSLGSCSLMARIGAILSPMLPLLNNFWPSTAYFVVAGLGIINLTISYFFLVETKNISLDKVHLNETSLPGRDSSVELVKTNQQN
uniref:MFS domain-containing protein n=1 Tax=Parastrongyloides trichosuri TaxID=131310 RepID=A0A0N4Z1P9_PARTI